MAMKVVILCGGLGTRLREETEFRPKPLVEVGGRPILWHIMKHYSVYGFRDFILCLGYKGDMIREYFLRYGLMNVDFEVHIGTGGTRRLSPNHDEADWRVILAETGPLTGTGGRIKRIEKYIEGETFLATYGDSVVDVPLDHLIEFHYQQDRIATVTAVKPYSRFGLLTVKDGIAQEFQEKPRLEAGWINAGFFVFERKVFDYLDDDCTLEQEPLARLAADGQLAVYQHDGIHRCLDTYRDWKALNEEWESGHPAWKTW